MGCASAALRLNAQRCDVCLVPALVFLHTRLIRLSFVALLAMTGASFRGTNLQGATFRGARLSSEATGADFTGSHLARVDFTGAHADRKVAFHGATLTNALVPSTWKSLQHVDLAGVKGGPNVRWV